MLLAEDPATLIHHTINNFNIQPDKQAVARVHESLATLQQARDLRVRDAEAALRRLVRQLKAVVAQHDDLVAVRGGGGVHGRKHDDVHASRIAALDTRKFRTAKAASDAEMDAERLAGQAADLAARLQELDLQGVDGGAPTATTPDGHAYANANSAAAVLDRRRDPVDDEVLLRLKVYRSLGIDIERDERDGDWTRAVIRNDRKGDVHVVSMDKKFSRFFYANYFWQTL